MSKQSTRKSANAPRREYSPEKLMTNHKSINHLLVKGNKIVQKTHYTMSLKNQKVLAYLISRIKPNQTGLTVVFSIKNYINIMGLSHNGTNFSSIKKAIRDIHNSSFWIEVAPHKYELWNWIADAKAEDKDSNNGIFYVTFAKNLKNYLFNKRMRQKTIYRLKDIIMMKSRYSPRLFEIFRSYWYRQYTKKRGLNYSLNHLRVLLGLTHKNKQTGRIVRNRHGQISYKYPSYHDLKRYVLKPAIHEMNVWTGFHVRWKPLRQGRKVTTIQVSMTKKNKHELKDRDKKIFYAVHHIPKNEQPYVRYDEINGTYYLNYDLKRSHHKGGSKNMVKGHFKDVASNKHAGQMRVQIPNTNKIIWVDRSAVHANADTWKRNHIIKKPRKFTYKNYLSYDAKKDVYLVIVPEAPFPTKDKNGNLSGAEIPKITVKSKAKAIKLAKKSLRDLKMNQNRDYHRKYRDFNGERGVKPKKY